jgi:anti-sigma regulatory factor (Ser/Thr protein kinase)
MTTAATDFAIPAPAAFLRPPAREAGIRLTDCLSTRSGPALRARLERRVFPGRLDQVACARRFISRLLARCPAGADAVLLTSELVTNTLLHTTTGAGGDFEVIACHGQGGIRVTVADEGSRRRPVLHPDSTLATSGRGLALVGTIAARWGHHGDDRGRAVWFELDCQ